mgnify:FL=1
MNKRVDIYIYKQIYILVLYGCGLVGIIGCGKCVIDQHLKKKKRVLKERKNGK